MKKRKAHPWRALQPAPVKAPTLSGAALAPMTDADGNCRELTAEDFARPGWVHRFNGKEVSKEEMENIKKEIERKQTFKKT
jgi:hypothetical protein